MTRFASLLLAAALAAGSFDAVLAEAARVEVIRTANGLPPLG